jgi:hypothetical protein
VGHGLLVATLPWQSNGMSVLRSAINKSRHQPHPVSFIGNPLLPLLYTQLHCIQRNSMVYMELAGLIAN